MSETLKKKLSAIDKDFRKLRKKAGNERELLILDLIYHTGVSVCELVHIKKSHFNFSSCRLFIPAENSINKRARTVPIPKSLAQRLEYFCIKNGYVFIGKKKQISKRRVEQLISACAKATGVNFTPKKIRNLFILKNSLQGKTAPTGLKHIKPVTFSSRVINTQKERDKIIFEIVKETGCKTSQLKTIKKSNLEGKFLHLRNCSFKLSDTLLDRLKKYCKTKEKNELIFKNKNNKPLSERRIQQIFSAFAGITPQQARKEYACRQYAMGKKRNEIKKELGLKRLDAFNYGLVKI